MVPPTDALSPQPAEDGGQMRYLVTIGDETLRIEVSTANDATDAFRDFYNDRDVVVAVILDERSGERLELWHEKCLVVRSGGPSDRPADYVEVAHPRRGLTASHLFFEDGHAGLDGFGRWVVDLTDLEASPEDQGAKRAAGITTEAAAIEELGRIWSDSGIVDPTDQYYVFFESSTAAEDRADRAVVVALIVKLGLERVETPADARDGEVWVRTDPRIEAEIENWA